MNAPRPLTAKQAATLYLIENHSTSRTFYWVELLRVAQNVMLDEMRNLERFCDVTEVDWLNHYDAFESCCDILKIEYDVHDADQCQMLLENYIIELHESTLLLPHQIERMLICTLRNLRPTTHND